MSFYRHCLRIALAVAVALVPLLVFAQGPGDGGGNQNQGLFLLEPIGGVNSIPTDGNAGLGVFGFYFGLLYPWIVGMGAGIAILNGVVGGIQIIQSGSDSDGVTKGKSRLMLSLGGLLLVLGSATILNALNPTFYR